MRFAGLCGDFGHRVGDQFGGAHALVGDAVDEAGVGAVFEQSAHQVRQQVFVAADRRVHAAGRVELVGGHHVGVQIGAHAVQALEFVMRAAAPAQLRGHVMHGGDGVGVVAGEHRVQQIAGFEHAPRAGQIAHVGVGLAGEHRVAGQAIDLRALDLGVPVGALDQTHRHRPADLARQRHDGVDHERCAPQIRLHREAIAVPAGQTGIGVNLGDQVEAQFQAIGFLGIDGEADALFARQLRQFEHARCQLAAHAGALGVLVARMQRGQLHRNAGRGEQDGERAAGADGADRHAVAVEVARGISGGERGLAEHVEGIAVGRVFALARALERVLDGAPHHELVAHDAHRLAHREPDHRLAGAAHQPAQCADHVAARFIGQIDHMPGQHQAPGGGVDEQRIALAQMRVPVGLAELVADQAVGGAGVGDAQQRFGHAHQQHAFLGAEVVLAHEGFDRALLQGAGAHRADQAHGGGLDRGADGFAQGGITQQFGDVFVFVAQPGLGDALALWVVGRSKLGRKNGGHGGRLHGLGAGCQCSRQRRAAKAICFRRQSGQEEKRGNSHALSSSQHSWCVAAVG